MNHSYVHCGSRRSHVERTQSSHAAEVPEAGPSFVESPMTRIWLQADNTRGVDIDAVACL